MRQGHVQQFIAQTMRVSVLLSLAVLVLYMVPFTSLSESYVVISFLSALNIYLFSLIIGSFLISKRPLRACLYFFLKVVFVFGLATLYFLFRGFHITSFLMGFITPFIAMFWVLLYQEKSRREETL